MPVFDNILQTIGRTPVIRIGKMGPRNVNMFVKVESFNPGFSVKDRLALAVIQDAEKKGLLKPGQTVVEATSGNTGVSLAMVCAVKGYPFVATMAESFSIERRKLMKYFGAKVVLTPKEEKGTGMVRKAKELSEKHGWFLTSQFTNEANAAYHRQTTGPEIIRDFADMQLDYFVSGYGTGGTITGAGQVIKAARPDCKIVVVEPEEAQLLKGEAFKPHMLQGWTPDFLPEVLDQNIFDIHNTVTGPESFAASRNLAKLEGILCGASAGGTMAGALKIAETAPEGSNILAMLPDTGERYLSTPLFESCTIESDEALL